MNQNLKTTEEKFERYQELLSEFLLGEMEGTVDETPEQAEKILDKINELHSLITDTSDSKLITMIIDKERIRTEVKPILDDLFLDALPEPDFL